ncbi:MAG TPA: hypothetical protein PLU30_00350 [Verrucomicrobiae bacterium]|nr:hypothetical protein [Verrucomicrobiae bacterium]
MNPTTSECHQAPQEKPHPPIRTDNRFEDGAEETDDSGRKTVEFRETSERSLEVENRIEKPRRKWGFSYRLIAVRAGGSATSGAVAHGTAATRTREIHATSAKNSIEKKLH